MPLRTLELAFLGNFRDLEAGAARAGVAYESLAKKIQGSADMAGRAAMAQAKAMGASEAEQVAAAGRAAAAFTRASGEITRAQKAAGDAAATAARTMGKAADEQRAAYGRAVEAQKQAEAATARATRSQETAAARSKKANEQIAGAGKWAAVGLLGAAAAGVHLGAAFQGTTASIAANAGTTTKAAQQIGDAFLGTMGKSIYSAQTIGQSYAQVAGQLHLTEGHALSTAEAMRVMTAAQDLAEGSGQSLGSATSALAGVMQAFHLSVGQAVGASDVLFNVSKALAVPLESVAQAVERLHGRLGELAPSLGDVGGLMLDLAHHGVMGQRGVMTVNSALQTLIGGGKKTTDVLKALGVSVFDQHGKFIGLHAVITQLQPKLAGLTQHQRFFAEQALFGKNAAQVMGQVVLEGARAFDANAGAASKAGSAHHAASVQSKTFGHEVDLLKATVQDLGTKLGLWLIPKLQAAGDAISSGIRWLDKHRAAATVLAATITGVLGLALTVFAYTRAVAFIDATKNMLSAMGRLAAKMGLTASAVTVADGEIEASNAAAGASFAATAGGAEAAGVKVGAAVEAEAAAVVAADGTIEAANVAAGASFTAMLGPIAAVVGAVLAAQPLINKLTGGGLSKDNATFSVPGSSPATAGETLAQIKAGTKLSGVTTLQGDPNVSRWAAIAQAASKKYGIPASLLLGDIQQESGGHPESVSSAGAFGVSQFIPSTAKQYGVKPGTSRAAVISQIMGQAHYLHDLGAAKDPRTALEHYFGTTGQSGQNYASAVIEAATRYKGADAQPAPTHASHGGGATSGAGNAAIQKLLQGSGAAGGKAVMRYYKHRPVGVMDQAQWQAWQLAHGSSPAAKAVRSLLYANPLPGMTSTGRTDQGVDYSATPGSAVDAIGAGVIDKIIPNWYKGQPLVEEQLTAGPNKGKYVYYAEQLKALVREGQRVAAGQRIGTVAASGTGLELGFGAGGGRTLAQATTGYTEGQVTPAGQAFGKFFPTLQHGIYTTTKGGTTTGGGSSVALTIGQQVQAFLKALQASASALLGKYGNLEQSGTSKTLMAALGVSTSGKTSTALHHAIEGLAPGVGLHGIDAALQRPLTMAAAGSGQEKSFESLVTQLKATHQAGLVKLAADLVAAHKSALNALAQTLYAEQVTKDAEQTQLYATWVKDMTTLQQNTDADTLNIAKAQHQAVVDAMQAQLTAIRDMTQTITDKFSGMVQSVQDATQRMSDTSSALVTGIQDSTQIQVDTFGERGLYGLNLIAQKLVVQYDIIKAGFDQQIAAAQANLDTVTTGVHVAENQAQLQVDSVTTQQNQLVALAQSNDDAVKIAAAIKIAAAQARLDAVTLHEDVSVVGPAQTAVDLGATLPKAQQAVLQAQLTHAQATANQAIGLTSAALAITTDQQNAIVFAADAALQNAQDSANALIGQAQQTLATIEGQGNAAIAAAQQVLQGIQGTAAQAEAQAQGAASVAQAQAQTQFAGTGTVVNIIGVPVENAAAVGAAVDWVARTQLQV